VALLPARNSIIERLKIALSCHLTTLRYSGYLSQMEFEIANENEH